MKKRQTQKLVSALVLIVLLCATLAGAYLGVFGRNTEYVTVRENDEDVVRALYRQVAYIPNTLNDTWREAMRPSAALGGGYRYALTAAQGDMSADDYQKALKSAAKILRDRAELAVGSASARVNGDTIEVTVSASDYDSLIAALLSPVGEYGLALMDSATYTLGEPVLDASGIQQAYYAVNDSGAYQVQLRLTKRGAQTINDLAAAHNGEYLYLVQDGEPVAYALLSAVSDRILSLSANDWMSAFVATASLRSGALPIALTPGDSGPAEATAGALLPTLQLVCAAALALVCVYLIARSRLGGLIGVWTLLAQIVVFCLLSALVSVAAAWTLDLLSLLVLIACEALFVFGLLRLVGALSGAVRGGRSAYAALEAGYKKNAKLLLIVYGALLAAGVLLMLIFQRTLYGILGRIVSLSALTSAAMLFLFLRVALTCSFRCLGSRSALYGAAK